MNPNLQNDPNNSLGQSNQPQPGSQLFPSNQSALQAERQQQVLAQNPAVQQVVSNSTFGEHKPVGWIVSVTLLIILLVSTAGFAYWAFSERQTYKNDSDKLVAAAVSKAEKETTDKNNKKFAEEQKNPLTNYTGPSEYGSIRVDYPKTWSGYVTETGGGSGAVFNAYFHPKIVPDVANRNKKDKASVALQVQVVDRPYDKAVAERESFTKTGKLSAVPYTLKKNPDNVGTLFTGELDSGLRGREIVLPLRDKAIVVTMETDDYLSDLENYILPNLSFVP